MSKQKFKRYTVDLTYEYADTGEDVIEHYDIIATSKSEAVIKAVNRFTDKFKVYKVTRERESTYEEMA